MNPCASITDHNHKQYTRLYQRKSLLKTTDDNILITKSSHTRTDVHMYRYTHTHTCTHIHVNTISLLQKYYLPIDVHDKIFIM